MQLLFLDDCPLSFAGCVLFSDTTSPTPLGSQQLNSALTLPGVNVRPPKLKGSAPLQMQAADGVPRLPTPLPGQLQIQGFPQLPLSVSIC